MAQLERTMQIACECNRKQSYINIGAETFTGTQ